MKTVRKFYAPIGFGLMALALVLSCGKSPNDSLNDDFSLSIHVADRFGYPVQGLQVSAWNDIVSPGSTSPSRNPTTVLSAIFRGDINCNGLTNEIADWVMFSSYLLMGESSFVGHSECSKANGDVNADGSELTLSDFVYLARIIVGDAPPSPVSSTDTVHAFFKYQNGELSHSSPDLGALVVRIRGEAQPRLNDNSAELRYHYDASADITTILVTAPLQGGPFEGFTLDILALRGELISIDAATTDGRPVAYRQVSVLGYLSWPYPNPSNSDVVVSLSFPVAANFTLSTFNLNGEQLDVIVDSTSRPGFVRIQWSSPSRVNTLYRQQLDIVNNGADLQPEPVYAAFFSDEPNNNVIGHTNAGGTANNSEAWRFPSLFDLPPIVNTDARGNSLGTIGYPGTTTVILTDPNTGERQDFKVELRPGHNSFSLVWK